MMNNNYYRDYYSLFERFSIMTIEGMSDEAAYDYLKDKTTPELLEQIKKRMQQRGNPDRKRR